MNKCEDTKLFLQAGINLIILIKQNWTSSVLVTLMDFYICIKYCLFKRYCSKDSVSTYFASNHEERYMYQLRWKNYINLSEIIINNFTMQTKIKEQNHQNTQQTP